MTPQCQKCAIFLRNFAQAMSSAEYVVEAVPEDEDLKKVRSRITEHAVSELQRLPSLAVFSPVKK